MKKQAVKRSAIEPCKGEPPKKKNHTPTVQEILGVNDSEEEVPQQPSNQLKPSLQPAKEPQQQLRKATGSIAPIKGAEHLSSTQRRQLGELFTISTSADTKRSYRRAERDLEEDHPHIWSHPSNVIAAILDQKTAGKSPSKMEHALCRRRQTHVAENVANNPLVVRTMKAYRKYWNAKKRNARPPISWDMLTSALQHIKDKKLTKDFAQFKYVVELAYCFGLRISEALRQDISEIHVTGAKAMLCVKKWKTKKSKKASYRVAVDPLADAVARKIHAKWEHQGCLAKGTYTLSAAFVNKILKEVGKTLKWKAPPGCFKTFSSHGFRHGRTVDLLKAGVERTLVCRALDMSYRNVVTYGIH